MSYRIERKGKMKVALGDGPEKEFDAIEMFDRWCEIDGEQRGEDGKITSFAAFAEAQLAFAKDVFGGDVTRAEAREFIKVLTDKVGELRRFFEPKPVETPSSAGNTEVRFAQ